MAIFVKFWGTRGSIPTPSSWTRVYGGNTSCVEVRVNDDVFICDAGSGIRELGKDILARNPRPTKLNLFITHTHWDHIQGFPFFVPAYLKAMTIRVYGAYRLLSGQMSLEYFPVQFRDLGANIFPDELKNGEKDIDGVHVKTFPLNHPGGCNGYLFEKDGKKIVYLTDNELEMHEHDSCPDVENTLPLRRVPPELVKIAQGADLLISDAQYDDKEYVTKKGWGHSSCFSVTDFAVTAKVKNLALFHHDPESTDKDIDAKVRQCCERAARFGARISIFAAREGMELKF